MYYILIFSFRGKSTFHSYICRNIHMYLSFSLCSLLPLDDIAKKTLQNETSLCSYLKFCIRRFEVEKNERTNK